MKNQRQHTGSQFIPWLNVPSPRKNPKGRFSSLHMRRIQEQVKKSQPNMRPIMGNRNGNASSRKENDSNKVGMHTSNSPPVRPTPPKGSKGRLSKTLLPVAKNTSNQPNLALASATKDLKQSTTSRSDLGMLGFKGGIGSKKLEKSITQTQNDGSNATLQCLDDSNPIKMKQGSVCNHNGLKAMPGLVRKAKNCAACNQCNDILGSRSKGQSNCDDRGQLVRKDRIERLKPLGEKVSSTLEGTNLLVPNNKNSKEAKEYNEEVIFAKGKDIQGHTRVASVVNTMNADVYSMCNDNPKKEGIMKANEALTSIPSLKGNQAMQDLRSNSRKNSFPRTSRDLSRQQRAELLSAEDNNCALLSSKHVEKKDLQNGDQPNECFQLGSTNQNRKFERKRKKEEKLKVHQGGNSEECVLLDSPNLKKSRLMKKGIRLELNEHEAADGANVVTVEDDTVGWTLPTNISKDHTKVTRQCYRCSLPIDESRWSGFFKLSNTEYVSLAAHLSTKSCGRVWELSLSLQPVVKVAKLSRSEAWPKRWEASSPSSDCIGLYFLPHQTRPDDSLDHLVKEVMDNDLVLQATVAEDEMLIFPSHLLPEQYRTFRGRHYLWGLFKRRTDKVDVVEQHGLGLSAQEEDLEIQHMPERQNDRSRVPGPNMDPELQAPEAAKTQDVDKELALTDAAEATAALTDAAAKPAIPEQINSSSVIAPGRVFGFVVGHTPRLEQLIREMKREGALVVEMRGEIEGPGLGRTAAME